MNPGAETLRGSCLVVVCIGFLFVRIILQNIFNIAFKNVAERFNRRCRNRAIVLQAINQAAAHVVVSNQPVRGDFLLLHCCKQWSIGYHNHHLRWIFLMISEYMLTICLIIPRVMGIPQG